MSRPESRPAPQRLDGPGSPRARRTLPPAVIMRAARPGLSAMDALKSIKTKFSPLDLGIKRIRTREAASGGIVM